jgi:GTP cyclohydrolase II
MKEKINPDIFRLVNIMLPTADGLFDFIAYNNRNNKEMPHLALVAKDTQLGEIVNVRVHSECMTGDVFGSKRCECGEQLSKAMEYTSANGGVIIYLRQEGRGIGLINKLHAYQKQDEGLDTAEANVVLGFEYDERTYEDAVYILRDLGIHKINILTNNPSKILSLEDGGIEVVKRIGIKITPQKENERYLETKRTKFGHIQ